MPENSSKFSTNTSSTKIPKGNTQKDVTSVVFSILNASFLKGTLKSLIDVPCGEGEFLKYVKQEMPQAKCVGIDRYAKNLALTDNLSLTTPQLAGEPKAFDFFKLNAQDYFSQEKPQEIDAITCISGVMCFDGIHALFESFHQTLKSGGLLIVTNDNILTARDRLNFLFFGHFKRFKLFYDKNEGNWNIIPPQGLYMLFERSGFSAIDIKYTSIYCEDLFWLPLALLLYPIFLLKILMSRSKLPFRRRLALYSPLSLIARHYVMLGRKP